MKDIKNTGDRRVQDALFDILKFIIELINTKLVTVCRERECERMTSKHHYELNLSNSLLKTDFSRTIFFRFSLHSFVHAHHCDWRLCFYYKVRTLKYMNCMCALFLSGNNFKYIDFLFQPRFCSRLLIHHFNFLFSFLLCSFRKSGVEYEVRIFIMGIISLR